MAKPGLIAQSFCVRASVRSNKKWLKRQATNGVWGTTSYCRIHYVLCGPSAAASTWHVTKTNTQTRYPCQEAANTSARRQLPHVTPRPSSHLCLAFVCCGSALVNFTLEIASVFTVHSGKGASHRQRHSQLPVAQSASLRSLLCLHLPLGWQVACVFVLRYLRCIFHRQLLGIFT